MCLNIDLEASKKLHDELNDPEGQGFIWAWKCLDGISGTLRSFFFSEYEWKPGLNKSDRATTQLSAIENDFLSVQRGIHVYRSFAEALNHYGVIARVKCRAADFVAASAFEAVFTQVELLQEDYDKALGYVSAMKELTLCV